MSKAIVGRLAPSPTGYLHLGNAWSFLWAWLWAKAQGGRVVLRMEDIDTTRSRLEFAKAIEDDLNWLGLSFDGQFFLQSLRHSEHVAALSRLEQGGHIYRCYCTRKELRMLAAAPHVEDYGAPYLGTCAKLSLIERTQKEQAGRSAALRVRCVFEQKISFNDAVYGEQHFDLQSIGGDFALRRSDGVMAYQLAVVVDDAAQGVTHILRGADILTSTPRQIFLCNLLQLPLANYAHVPLLLDEDGQRLAKRHAALSLQALRDLGVRAERIVGLLAYLGGLCNEIIDVHPAKLVDNFCLSKCHGIMARKDIVVTSNHIKSLCL